MRPKTETAPNCLQCQKPLRRYSYRNEPWAQPNNGWGDYGDGFFCSRTCGYRFAVSTVELMWGKPIEHLIRRVEEKGHRRINAKKILENPDLRRKLMIQTIMATQAREGIDTTWEQAEAAYDKVLAEKS